MGCCIGHEKGAAEDTAGCGVTKWPQPACLNLIPWELNYAALGLHGCGLS